MADDFFHRKTTNGIVYAVFPGEQLRGYLFLCFGNHLPDPFTQLRQLLSWELSGFLALAYPQSAAVRQSSSAEIDSWAGKSVTTRLGPPLTLHLALSKVSPVSPPQPMPTATPAPSFLTRLQILPCSSCRQNYRPWMGIYLLNGTRRCPKDNYGTRFPSQFYFDETL